MQQSDSHATQLKRFAPFLDSHVLLFFLKNNVPGSERLQDQLASQLLLSKKEEAKELEAQAREEATKLVTLINNTEDKQQLRQDRQFTLEKLHEDRGITIEDCKKLFSYAKILYEMGEYKNAERYLFPLKEILNQEQHNTELILQIFWGLLSCEILQKRERATVERTTQRKLKEIIDKIQYEGSISLIESMNQRAWFLHQILVYCFTNRCTDLFQNMLAERQFFGSSYLNVIQVRCQYLLRYYIVSLFINRIQDEFIDIVLPIILQEKDTYSDSFTQFIEALYEDYDFERAQSLVQQMVAEAQGDLLLKNYANEIQFQATLLVNEVKAQVYKTIDLGSFVEVSGRDLPSVCRALEEHMAFEGFQVKIDVDAKSLTIVGQDTDIKSKIMQETDDMVKRTLQLNEHYHKQVEYLRNYTQGAGGGGGHQQQQQK